MRLDDDLATFLQSPVMIIIGSHDAAGQPQVGRGHGALVDAVAGVVELLFSRWLWPGTAGNIAANGAIAVTFARPRDYAAYQIKGKATLLVPEPRHVQAAAAYDDAIRAALGAQGIPPPLIASWLSDRDPVVARIAVAEAFVQTPGPRAGLALEPTA